MSAQDARKLLIASQEELDRLNPDSPDERSLPTALGALVLAVQALTEAALCDHEVSIASLPDWVNEGRLQAIGEALDEPEAIPDPWATPESARDLRNRFYGIGDPVFEVDPDPTITVRGV